MTERYIDSQALEQSAMFYVNKLKNVAARHERVYPSIIQAVWVFSGPGTYYDKLKPGQEEHLRWMDRDRIRAGVAVVREVTASRLSEILGKRVKSADVTKEDIADYGPYFVYNGIPLENDIIRKALDSQNSKLPKNKVVIIDQVWENGTRHPIKHTGDQYKSFFQEIANDSSPLLGLTSVALVAHIPDFVRHPFYADLNNALHYSEGHTGVKFFAYGLRSRPGTEDQHVQAELSRLIQYAHKGDLSIRAASLQI